MRFRADDVDYLRASVPIDTVERLAKSESVATLNVNGSTTSPLSLTNAVRDVHCSS